MDKSKKTYKYTTKRRLYELETIKKTYLLKQIEIIVPLVAYNFSFWYPILGKANILYTRNCNNQSKSRVFINRLRIQLAHAYSVACDVIYS